jgi:ubiquinone/menaquinone biosynthesis C-methylase UbiE
MISRKIKTAVRHARTNGISGLYEVAMYRYFWPIGMLVSRNAAKHWEERRYWRKQAIGGPLGNAWYQSFFTEPFGLTVDSYTGQRLLDVGCGPRGSLEWADLSAERIGLDPLVATYRQFGIQHHKMQYVEARSEEMPFGDDHFDFVSCLNALDHVDDVKLTLNEIFRVLKPGGQFLLIVDVGHAPTLSEPHRLSWDVLDSVKPVSRCHLLKRFVQHGGAMSSVHANELLPNDSEIAEQGVLLAMLEKN